MRKMLMFYILLGLLSITASQNLCKEQGYPEGRYGPHCSTTCSEGCFDTCDPISGACSCKPGWFSLKCQERCSPNCHGGLCEETNGTCVECGPGKWGAFCQYNCSFNCKDSECSRKEGTCRCEGMSRMDRCQIRDISTGKPVRMSSRSPSSYSPRRITYPIRNCSHLLHICTEEEANPWLTIDLQGLHIIHKVNLVLPDNYRGKAVARALEILVGNDSFATNNKTTVGDGVGYSVSFQPPILGSHVTIRRITPHGITKLCVCMVQVIGTRDPNIGCVPGKWGNYCQRDCPFNCNDSRCNWEDDTCECKDGNIGDRCQTRESNAPGLSVGISIVIGLVVAGAVICTLIVALYCKCRHRKRTWHLSEEDENELK